MQVGQEESAYDGRPKCNPDVLANARADKAAASIVPPKHEGREGLKDRRAAYPQDGIAHLDRIVELNRKPLGCGAGGHDEGNSPPRRPIGIFQPPCQRGRLGRTYPGGAVVPFSHGMPPEYRRVHFTNGDCKEYAITRSRTISVQKDGSA